MIREAKYFIEKLEKELRVRDDIIHELEVRLTLPSNSDDLLNCSSEDTIDYTIEIKNLQTQLEALQKALAHKDNEIDALNIALENRAQGKRWRHLPYTYIPDRNSLKNTLDNSHAICSF